MVTCEHATVIGTDRYQECAACGLVLVNVDGLHRPRLVEGMLW